MRIFVKDLHDMEGVARFDPTVTPKTIDYLHLSDSDPDKGKMGLGIYELQGDTLRICWAITGPQRGPAFAILERAGRVPSDQHLRAPEGLSRLTTPGKPRAQPAVQSRRILSLWVRSSWKGTPVAVNTDYSSRDQDARLTFYVLLWKRRGITLEQFDDYWRDVHGPVCARLPGQFQYWQYHVAHNEGGLSRPSRGSRDALRMKTSSTGSPS